MNKADDLYDVANQLVWGLDGLYYDHDMAIKRTAKEQKGFLKAVQRNIAKAQKALTALAAALPEA